MECEDAIGINRAAGRFAVADGATEAFDARSWARLLAEGWVVSEPPALTPEAFGAWVAGQGTALHGAWEGRTLSWYAEEKARRGSFAAFVGVQLELTNGAPHWAAIVLYYTGASAVWCLWRARTDWHRRFCKLAGADGGRR